MSEDESREVQTELTAKLRVRARGTADLCENDVMRNRGYISQELRGWERRRLRLHLV